MNHSGRKVIAAGNIGYPLSLAALKSNTLDAIVVEVSSFQLEKVNAFKADAAVILNISSDHINRYDSFSHYAETKLRLLQATDKKANRLINHSIKMLNLKCAESETFGGHRSELQQSSATCRYKNQTIFSKADLAVKGDHNFENAMAAAWLSLKSGLKPDQIAQSLSSFQSGAHRLELIYKSEGIQIYNDSKSTNPDALCRAIETVRSPNTKNIILIAGGRDKMMDFSKSVKLLQNNVKTAILIGETKTRLKQVWKNSAKCLISTNLKDAVNTAFEELSGNETILLSPGCASQDMFRDYKARGEVFRDEILRRINNENL
jgi:UDP-N-acetylmuramoylalanine--D-glutamate ligase